VFFVKACARNGANLKLREQLVHAIDDNVEAFTFSRSATIHNSTSLRLSGKTSLYETSEAITELLRVRGTIALQHTSLIKQEMRDVLLELAIAVAEASGREHNVVA
jgi:hypothetical protein